MIKSHQIEPVIGNAFKNCVLQRKKYADILTNVIETYSDGFVLALNNKWGTGKTTFIKSLCQYLGVTDSISSPTYSIVNEHLTKSSLKIFHVDLYRLNSEQELFELGFEEYINSSNYVFIECPKSGEKFWHQQGG